jgi:precorrin-6A/cobalt-precorrin-6A reductase
VPVPADPPRRRANRPRVLILGGTSEARELARCAEGRVADTVTSLAGVVAAPALPAGELRTGGFGGPGGLADHLRGDRVDAVVDATHPFAATITASALAATAATGIPLLVVRRPGWVEAAGDDWRRVPTLAAAAELLPGLGERVFLTTGRTTLAAFAGVRGCWFLARSVEPPVAPLPAPLRVLLARGPFDLPGERALLDAHRIDVVVTKDSGGPVGAKLTAARERGIPVIMVDRPPVPPGAPVVGTVEAALDWLAGLSGAAPGAADRCP